MWLTLDLLVGVGEGADADDDLDVVRVVKGDAQRFLILRLRDR